MKTIAASLLVLILAGVVLTDPPATQPEFTSGGWIASVENGKVQIDTAMSQRRPFPPVKLDGTTEIVLANGQPGKASDLKADQRVRVRWVPIGRDVRFIKIEVLPDLEKNVGAVDVPASQPSKLAADRAEKLKADVKTFSLLLEYNGPQDKPYYRLLLSVAQVPKMEQVPFKEVAQITEDQGKAIINHLAVEGFLDNALVADHLQFRPSPVPIYMLTVRTEGEGRPIRYQEWLDFDLKMLQRLDGLRKLLDGDAAKSMDLLLGRLAGHRKEWEGQATSQPDIATLITDLSSDDGKVRVAATKAIFALGKDTLEPLQNAGAKQISPFGTISTRRIDMVYSLLDGLKPNPVPARAGYRAGGFGIRVEKNCTQADVEKMGEKFGFTISGNFAPDTTPSCYVQLKPGKNLADVLKAILSDEPKIISVNLNYFET